LLKGEKGVRVFAKARLGDRIDAIIPHEYEEDRLGTHELAVKHAPRTELPIGDRARRIPGASLWRARDPSKLIANIGRGA